MSNFFTTLKNLKNSHFFRVGLPFLLLVVGGSFATREFQKVKYDERKRRRDSKFLETYGIKPVIDMEEEYEKIQAANENHEWRNIRGPRPYEDNTEFLRNRELQEKVLRDALTKGERYVQRPSSRSSPS